MNNLFKKTLTFVLIASFAFSPAFAIPAMAQWVVWDPGNFVPNSVVAVNTTISAGSDVGDTIKEYGLDAVAGVIANLIIERMSASTVKWINSGFKGKPAYVTDPTAYFANIGNGIAGQFIFSNPNLNFLCGTMSAKIKLALANNYNGNGEGAWRCTLTGVIDNVDGFMNDFEQGGWDGFFLLTQEQQNNPVGAYIQAEGELARQIAEKVGEKDKELSWGGGFMSQKECVTPGAPTVRTVYNLDGTSKQVTEEGPCLKERTVTPGETISNQLNKQLGMGNERLAVADEINEIVSALLNRLASTIVGGIGKGLRSLSSPDPVTGNETFNDKLSNQTTVVDYFCVTDTTDPNYNPNIKCGTPDTSVLDTPPPDLDYNLDSGKPTSDPGYPGQPSVNP